MCRVNAKLPALIDDPLGFDFSALSRNQRAIVLGKLPLLPAQLSEALRHNETFTRNDNALLVVEGLAPPTRHEVVGRIPDRTSLDTARGSLESDDGPGRLFESTSSWVVCGRGRRGLTGGP